MSKNATTREFRGRRIVVDVAGSNAILTSRATAQAVRIAEGLRFATLDELLSQMRSSSLPGDVTQHFIDFLTERAKGLINSAVDATANEAFALGRHDEAMFFRDEIAECVFTALLDGSCLACIEADGAIVEFGSRDYERLRPPYRECAGGLRCRCQFVFTLKTEVRGEGLTTGGARHLRRRQAR